MSETKFTRGPWCLAGKGTIRAGTSNWIASINWFNRKANAELISAAPDLFHALERMTNRYVEMVASGDCGFWNAEEEDFVIAARAALSKANPPSSSEAPRSDSTSLAAREADESAALNPPISAQPPAKSASGSDDSPAPSLAPLTALPGSLPFGDAS